MGSNPATLVSLALGPGALFVAPQVYQAEEAHKARRQAQDEAGKQADQFRQAQGDLASRQAASEATGAADAARRSSRRRQLSIGTAGTGRSGTILSGGLGAYGAGASEGKTLLGA